MSVLDPSSDEPTMVPDLPYSAWPDASVTSNAPPLTRLRKLVPLKLASVISARSRFQPFE
jgi:hypothetical protein